jgi:hypothetical protein
MFSLTPFAYKVAALSEVQPNLAASARANFN